MEAVPPDVGGHPLAGVLGGAKTQAVQAQGVFIVILARGVFAAGVHLAEDQLPVVAVLLGVIVHRNAAAAVLHLDAAILEAGEGDAGTVALPGLVDGVGEDLEDGVGAALHPVGAEDDCRAFAHPVGALEADDALV